MILVKYFSKAGPPPPGEYQILKKDPQEMRAFSLISILVHLSDARELFAGSRETWSRPAKLYSKPFSLEDPTAVAKGTYDHKSPLDSLRMPGTKWCGKGWRTDSFYQLGGYSSADRCCRQHDLGCKESIQPGELKYGLLNARIHTVMHCSCDDRFRSCLKMAKTSSAYTVGHLFFNVFSTPCYVITEKEVCTEHTWWGKCRKVEVVKKATWRKPVRY